MTTIFSKKEIFQSTTSQGGRPGFGSDDAGSSAFQFTTSQGGRQSSGAMSFWTSNLSIHDLTRRSTLPISMNTALAPFQFTTSQGGRRETGYLISERLSFNSRPHKEVDYQRHRNYSNIRLSIHYLTRRSTSSLASTSAGRGPFNSRPHKEVDGNRRLRVREPGPFNSRPHKEVDYGYRRVKLHNELSIHDLTRRSTNNYHKGPVRTGLSIHDLTRRSTGFWMIYSMDRRSFQFTTSQGGRPKYSQLLFRPDHLSIHDLTRRSTLQLLRIIALLELSIHDLTRRSTPCRYDGKVRLQAFQFTTSQGGRRHSDAACHAILEPFNSRPHKEVDDIARTQKPKRQTFNSRPHKEVDFYAFRGAAYKNLSIHDLTRRSTEIPLELRSSFTLSIHDLTRRSTPSDRVISDICSLSIHDLTRRSTANEAAEESNQNLSIHDLTRRSTGVRSGRYIVTPSFNSRPHKEVDLVFLRLVYDQKVLSIHDLTRRSTYPDYVLTAAMMPFNSRPHKEVDRNLNGE